MQRPLFLRLSNFLCYFVTALATLNLKSLISNVNELLILLHEKKSFSFTVSFAAVSAGTALAWTSPAMSQIEQTMPEVTAEQSK